MRVLAATILLASVLMASPTATVTGRVTDPSGAAIPGVDVRAINIETGLKQAVQTNDEGLYRILNLAPGSYRIVMEKHGFKMIIKPGVELHVQDIIALNFEMQIGSVSESITVEEGALPITSHT